MFLHNKETNTYWFNSNSTDFLEFHLIGKISNIYYFYYDYFSLFLINIRVSNL